MEKNINLIGISKKIQISSDNMIALEKEHKEIAQLLLEEGSDIYAVNIDQKTPVELARRVSIPRRNTASRIPMKKPIVALETVMSGFFFRSAPNNFIIAIALIIATNPHTTVAILATRK